MKYEERDRQYAENRGDTATGGEIALDIEAINLVEPPDLDFQSPVHWTVFCVPLGHRPAGSDGIKTTVLFRRGPTPCDEFELLERLAEWIRVREPDRILTYNGLSYDYPVLKHRSRVSSHECPGSHNCDIDLILDGVKHTDLFQTVKNRTGSNVPLNSSLAYHGIDVPDTFLDGEKITGADMPELGVQILVGDASFEQGQAVKKYAESDVEPLFELYDALSE